MAKEIKTSSSREVILTINDDIMTIITDQDILQNDILHSNLHCRKDSSIPINLHVDEIIESRKSRGDWKSTPPNWFKIKFHRS